MSACQSQWQTRNHAPAKLSAKRSRGPTLRKAMPWVTSTRKQIMSVTSCSHHTHNCACTGMEETSRWHWMLPSPRAQIKLHRAAVHDSVSYEQRKEERLRSGHIMVWTQCLCLCHIPLANAIPQNNSSREVQGRKPRFNGLSGVLMMT